MNTISINTLRVGDLAFQVKRSNKRRTLEIAVERGGELSIIAPTDVAESRLRDFATEKRFWVYTKLAEKEQLQRSIAHKQYIDGEGFLYLGKSYRLLIVPEQDAPLKLQHGRLQLNKADTNQAREHLIRWYSDKAKPWLENKVQDFAQRMEVDPAGVRVQDLGYRWGSCGKGNWLYFHWKSILLPPRIVEYIVVHELAHLREPHHTPDFWRCIERTLPDFERRKVWLAEHGMDVEGV